MKRAVALAVLIILIGVVLFLMHGLTSTIQTYPQVVDPGQAYILPNGTLYMSVYNSWTNPATINSLQVAYVPTGEAQDAFSVILRPNVALGDGAVEIYCCTGSTGPLSQDQTLASSQEWKGGGTVEAGGVALLKFAPPASISLEGYPNYYVAIGDQWFPTENLEPFVLTASPNYTLPSFIPTRAIIYPNETMQLAMFSTGQSSVPLTANVSLRDPALAGWPPGFSNLTYAVFPEGGPWYRLVPGVPLPPYMPLSANLYNFGNYTSFAIYGITGPPLVFQNRLVSQVPPILAPTATETSSSWSSGEGPQQWTMSYAVEWQLSPSGAGGYRLPVTLYGGQYSVNASQKVQVQVGGVQLNSPGSFNTSYFEGDIVVTPLNSQQTNGSMDVVLSFGPRMPGVQFNSVTSSAGTLPLPVYAAALAIAIVVVAYGATRLRRPRGAQPTPAANGDASAKSPSEGVDVPRVLAHDCARVLGDRDWRSRARDGTSRARASLFVS
jgi:hypothetical protein